MNIPVDYLDYRVKLKISAEDFDLLNQRVYKNPKYWFEVLGKNVLNYCILVAATSFMVLLGVVYFVNDRPLQDYMWFAVTVGVMCTVVIEIMDAGLKIRFFETDVYSKYFVLEMLLHYDQDVKKHLIIETPEDRYRHPLA